MPVPSPPHSCPPPATSSVSSHHTLGLFPLPYPPALATNTIHILLLALVDRALPLRLYDPRIELPRCRVLSLMALFLAAGLVHNWCLHYAPSLGAIFTFSACLDRDFIGKSRFCGVPTVWQSIFGARVECIFRAKVLATSPNYCCLSRIFLCSAILCPHSRRSFLSLRPLQDPISQAKLEALFQVLRFLSWASFWSVSVFGLACFLLRLGASWGTVFQDLFLGSSQSVFVTVCFRFWARLGSSLFLGSCAGFRTCIFPGSVRRYQ